MAWAAAWMSNGTAQPAPEAGGRQNPAGRYQIEGVHEVGAELRLHPDNRFEFGMAYGGVDQSAQGRWLVTSRSITLTTDTPPSAGFTLSGTSASLPDVYAADSSKPTMLVVLVKTPKLGLTWSNMAVVAEFSNGQSRAGITGNNGMLGFLSRTEPEWRGAYIKRISVAYPKGKVDAKFFSVDKRPTRSIEIDFEPGPLAPQAFMRAVFGIRNDGQGLAPVQQSPEGPGEIGWKFVKR